MKKLYTILLLLLMSWTAFTQDSRMYERTFQFENGSLVSSSPEQTSMHDSLGIGKYLYGMKNLIALSDTFYQVYSDAAEGAVIGHIFFRKSADGLTWSEPVQVTSGNDVSAGSPAIAVGQSKGPVMFVVSWSEMSEGNVSLVTSYSMNHGVTFTEPVLAAQVAAQGISGQVVVDSSYRLHALWTTYSGCWGQLFYSMSDNLGDSWTPSEAIYTGNCYSSMPVIEVRNGSEIIVAMYDDQFWTSNIRIIKSVDGGDTWTTGQATNYAYPQGVYFPTLAVAPSGNVHMFCNFWVAGDDSVDLQIQTTVSTDFGSTWDTLVTVNDATMVETSNIISQLTPAAVVSSNGVIYVTWSDARNDLPNDQNFDTFLAWSSDNGATWSENVIVNEDISGVFQSYASIAVTSNGPSDNVVVVWIDNRCDELELTLTAEGNTMMVAETASAYQWYLDGNEIFGATSQWYDGTESGTYTVEVTIGACTAFTEQLEFVYIGTEESQALTSFRVYPNPAHNHLILSMDTPFHSVSIRDATGRIVLSQTFAAARTRTVDISMLAPGFYAVEVDSGQVVNMVKE